MIQKDATASNLRQSYFLRAIHLEESVQQTADLHACPLLPGPASLAFARGQRCVGVPLEFQKFVSWQLEQEEEAEEEVSSP